MKFRSVGMRIHIIGICGTFMGSLAAIAKEAGHTVTGSDAAVYPPMSTQLESLGIELMCGYDPKNLQVEPDIVIIGNALSRGNPEVEAVLDNRMPYTSGAQWLSVNILANRWVLAVSGTHGKTTTTSVLAFILEQAGLQPGFLIGGVPADFPVSARLGNGPFFVIEADEYDTCFFDKRSKFLHYRPQTLIMNNLEFDHADIFDDLSDIKKQFQFLLRTVPSTGQVIYPQADKNLDEVLQRGCWSEQITFGDTNSQWRAENIEGGGSEFDVYFTGEKVGRVNWSMLGTHNVQNALAALAAARHVGVKPEIAIQALNVFQGVKRRMEIKGKINGVTVYDDFAHHPTAIESTLAGLRAKVGEEKITAVVEFGSDTMAAGVHRDELPHAFNAADQLIFLRPNWDVESLANEIDKPVVIHDSVDDIISDLVSRKNDVQHVVIMSNKGFGGIHTKLVNALER